MKTAIMTDTNSGISIKKGKELGIYVLPMPVLIDGKIFYEGDNFDKTELFIKQKENHPCSTSQPSPGEVIDMWEDIFKDGYEQIIYIPMSSGLSSSCHTATSLAQDYDGKIEIANNHAISVTLKQSVLNALEMSRTGMDALSIKKELEKTSFQASIYISVDSLEQLKKGGRVSSSAAAIATALNIKPVLTIQGEKLDAYKKCRGMKKCMKEMLEGIKNDLNDRFSDCSCNDISIGVASTFLNDDDINYWFSLTKEYFPDIEIFYDDLPCSIGCHIGVGGAGIGICKKWKE